MKGGVCVPINNLLIAGALPLGSGFTFGSPVLPGLAAGNAVMGGGMCGGRSGFTPEQQV